MLYNVIKTEGKFYNETVKKFVRKRFKKKTIVNKSTR